MKKLLFALVAISLFSCKEESKVEEAVAKIPIEFKVERFDRIFWTFLYHFKASQQIINKLNY